MKKGFNLIIAISPHGAEHVIRGEALFIKSGRTGFHDVVELAREQIAGPPLVAIVPDDWMLKGEFNQ